LLKFFVYRYEGFPYVLCTRVLRNEITLYYFVNNLVWVYIFHISLNSSVTFNQIKNHFYVRKRLKPLLHDFMVVKQLIGRGLNVITVHLVKRLNRTGFARKPYLVC